MILTPLNVPLKELMVTSSTSPRLKKIKVLCEQTRELTHEFLD